MLESVGWLCVIVKEPSEALKKRPPEESHFHMRSNHAVPFKSGASTDSAMPPKGSQRKAEACFTVTFGKIGVFQETSDALRVPERQIWRPHLWPCNT